MAKGECIECGDAFRGRADKKFCSDNCRSQYNNRRYQSNKAVVKINKILKHNYRILKHIKQSISKRSVPLEYLKMEGFIMDYCTHIQNNGKQKTQYCYDYGIRVQEDGNVRILREKEKYQP